MNTLIPSTFQGQRLDIALAALYPDFSRTQLSAALKSGNLLIDGIKKKPNDRVRGEEVITLSAGALVSTSHQDCLPEDIALDIIYEDESLLVLNKPAGLVVHPGAGNREHTLLNALLFYHPPLQDLPRAGIIHRLDKDTTGLLIVAKTPGSYQRLVEQMRSREIHRYYLALVHGQVVLPNTLMTPFGRDPKNRIKMAVRREGKEAITSYLPLQQAPLKKFSLLQIQLQTGRTHQIRVHMAYIKHPIVGDPLYSTHQTSLFNRQALHAHQLHLLHPITQAPIQLEVPPPDDFQQLLRQLGFAPTKEIP